MVEFQRLIGGHAPGAELLDTDRFVASSVPGIPSSLMNAATPIDRRALAPQLDEIERFYPSTAKWGAWIDPGATEDVAALVSLGLVLDSSPVLMAAELDAIAETISKGPRPGASTVDIGDAAHVERADLHDVGAVNDAAYGYPKPVLAPTLAPFPADELHAYGIRVNRELASVALLIDAQADVFVTMVATVPQHRGKHLASSLLAHALREAKLRGQQTTSLQASKLGQGIYARLGYRALGEVHLYEKRPQ
jgi:ribosomal protein S18 acetylase RimI-like enzyme